VTIENEGLFEEIQGVGRSPWDFFWTQRTWPPIYVGRKPDNSLGPLGGGGGRLYLSEKPALG
jgi:hypothetical protein